MRGGTNADRLNGVLLATQMSRSEPSMLVRTFAMCSDRMLFGLCRRAFTP